MAQVRVRFLDANLGSAALKVQSYRVNNRTARTWGTQYQIRGVEKKRELIMPRSGEEPAGKINQIGQSSSNFNRRQKFLSRFLRR